MNKVRASYLLFVAMLVNGCFSPPEIQPETRVDSSAALVLRNEAVSLEVSPRLGGRVLAFGLHGRDNLLRVSDEITAQPTPEVSPEADNIGYLGHEIWLGPQSQWWLHQNVNPARRAAAAQWPPDPYLAFADNAILQYTAKKLVLEGLPSPVSGMQVRKTYRLTEQPNEVLLEVDAVNVRDEPVAWGIWFNTRVAPSMHAYVPVAAAEDIRAAQFTDDQTGPIGFRLEEGLLRLEQAPLPEGITGRRGKLFIQPSAGWLAAFSSDQVFIIRFAHHPPGAIHPEQGQVELYLDHQGTPEQGLLELEVHAPYVQLAAGETMSASERWTALPYAGAPTPGAHRAFLRAHLGRDF